MSVVSIVAFLSFPQISCKGYLVSSAFIEKWTGQVFFSKPWNISRGWKFQIALLKTPKHQPVTSLSNKNNQRNCHILFDPGSFVSPTRIMGTDKLLVPFKHQFGMWGLVQRHQIAVQRYVTVTVLETFRSAQLLHEECFSSTLCCTYRLLGFFSQHCSGLDS